MPLSQENRDSAPFQSRVNTISSQESGGRYGYREMKSVSRRPSDIALNGESDRSRSQSQSRRPSVQSNSSAAGRKRSMRTMKQTPRPSEDIDDSPWIHRDKLAQIEIQEMEAAGVHVRQPRRSESSAGPGASRRSSRSVSRSGARRPVSKDQQSGEEPSGHTSEQRKRVSTIPAADEEEQGFDPAKDAEIRTPEEIAAEHNRQHMIRPSTSRIPVSKASPAPVSHTVLERESPLPRSRHGSNALSWDDMQYVRRARSTSLGNAELLDDPDGPCTASRPASSRGNVRNSASPETTPLSGSPYKARIPHKATPTSGGRKVSGANGVPRPTSSHFSKPRTPSGVTGQRPSSSAGHKKRPSTSHNPPEGEAPWIASMYKPDPRLPPEQQMLPTHAKRMLQEQWEKEGKTGSAYDRDFNLLNDTEMQKPKSPVLALDNQRLAFEHPKPMLSPKPSQQLEKSPPSSQSNKPWPLTPTISDKKSETGSVRPGTSGGGGYRITPTISSPPTIQRPPTSSGPAADGLAHNATPRVPEFDEKEEAKPKKGCCCVVM